jgi:uncharacterized protein YcbX
MPPAGKALDEEHLMSGAVSALTITPVKGTQVRSVQRIELERAGARSNRRFFLIDQRGRMLNGKQLGELNSVISDYSEDARQLGLRFPDGRVVEDQVKLGDSVVARFYSRAVDSRLVDGPWSQALSTYLGQALRLVESDGAVDRGRRGAASLISRASLARLAGAAGESQVDARRFRMLLEIDGVAAHAEDGWVGHDVRIGGAVVRFHGHVGRCLITSRDPETGVIDLPTLDILGSYRRDQETTEPLPFGIYGEVLRDGPVRVGDPVLPDG